MSGDYVQEALTTTLYALYACLDRGDLKWTEAECHKIFVEWVRILLIIAISQFLQC
jgi:hypothetical protein